MLLALDAPIAEGGVLAPAKGPFATAFQSSKLPASSARKTLGSTSPETERIALPGAKNPS